MHAPIITGAPFEWKSTRSTICVSVRVRSAKSQFFRDTIRHQMHCRIDTFQMNCIAYASMVSNKNTILFQCRDFGLLSIQLCGVTLFHCDTIMCTYTHCHWPHFPQLLSPQNQLDFFWSFSQRHTILLNAFFFRSHQYYKHFLKQTENQLVFCGYNHISNSQTLLQIVYYYVDFFYQWMKLKFELQFDFLLFFHP